MDFAIGLVNFVINLPDGQVKFSEEFKLQKNCQINLLIKTLLGLVEMMLMLASACPNGKLYKWISSHTAQQHEILATAVVCGPGIPQQTHLVINPLSSNIDKQILQTDVYTFPYRISWEKLIKDQRFFSLWSFD